jgi:hypothetical protein
MSRRTVIVMLVMLMLLPLRAQETEEDELPPDYRVSNTSFNISEDGREIVVQFSVYNSGGTATEDATVQLVEVRDSSQVLAETTLAPLEGNGGNVVDAPIRFPITRYQPGESIALNVIVNLEEDPAPLNNAGVVEVTIPDYDLEAVEGEAPDDEPADLESYFWWQDLPFDWSNSAHLALLIGVVAILMLLALFIKLFIGLFRRNPAFGNWQPPYATMPPLDPQSTYGRRQAWQQYAQNNVVPMPCRPNEIYARKVLLGMDGIYLSGWRVVSVRLTQYDMYGRVARSQVLATSGMVKRLTRAARRSSKITDNQLARRVRPVAKGMARQFKKRISKRSAMLPIALDVRLRGTHGEVRIMFELYECSRNYPQKIDFWEPEMTVVGRTIYETYTYTIYGQIGNESYRAFQKRLAGDLERVLVEMMRVRSTVPDAQAPPSYSGPSSEALSGTQPIETQEREAAATPAAEETDENEEVTAEPGEI